MKKKKDKKGITSLEIAISVLVIVVAIAGLVDLTTILQRTNTVSMNTAYISRVVGSQGGVRNNKIENFAGNYVDSNELYRNVKKSMNSSGIPDEEWEVKIDGRILTPVTNVPLKDYGNKIKIKASVNYKWALTSNVIPGQVSGVHSSDNEVYTTHKIRNGGFQQAVE